MDYLIYVPNVLTALKKMNDPLWRYCCIVCMYRGPSVSRGKGGIQKGQMRFNDLLASVSVTGMI